ncbi:transcriptional regulator, TetR family [Pseudonocardia thermophila]|uniref:Transcriptional regulator, TetR family n=1 Tax=Pseudonocardia thermophila TaxID=1848 RepID=A0A1M6RWF9_PSETH|nr:TetR/AcrR family transcriptional regulator [Pseudonocardia thermophila]SHK36793.1 transcriptional regulator, TetR family [Pseudonocardia thermophila]
MAEPATDPTAETDGRRRRGRQRRQALVEATRRLIGREGLSAVSQRAVAAEAGLPPSSVYYYFATIDDLVRAVLVDCNDRFLAALDALPTGPDAVRAIAEATVGLVRGSREDVLAELELWMQGARHPALRGEIDRWNAAVRRAATALTDDPVAIDAVVAAINGWYWLATTTDDHPAEHLEAVLRHIVAGGPAPA